MNTLKTKLGGIGSQTKKNSLTYLLVTVAFIIISVLKSGGMISSSFQGMLVPICVYVVMAISLNLTVGVLGELSLGHAGFMSIGAFMGVTAASIMQTSVASDPIRLGLAMLIGAGFAAIFGFLIGIPVLRLNGDYLAIVTLAFGEIIKVLFNNLYIGIDSAGLHLSLLEDNTNLLEDGRLIIEGPMGIGSIDKIATFTAGFILIIITLFIVFNLVNSRTGRAVMAIRDNRIAAESVGIQITKYKMIAFVVSAALAGAAGALFGLNYSTVIANKFDFNASILILVFVVLGGQGNFLGSIISATALVILPEVLREFMDYRMLAYAILLIGVMIATNNSKVRDFFSGLRLHGKEGKSK